MFGILHCGYLMPRGGQALTQASGMDHSPISTNNFYSGDLHTKWLAEPKIGLWKFTVEHEYA
jgi:hypothetical protein